MYGGKQKKQIGQAYRDMTRRSLNYAYVWLKKTASDLRGARGGQLWGELYSKT